MTKEGMMPDFTNWGFNNNNQQSEQNNGYGSDNYSEPEQSPVEEEQQQPVSDSFSQDGVDSVAETPAPADDNAGDMVDEPAETEDKPKGKAKGRSNRKPREKTMPHIEEQFGKKLIPLVKSLDDERVISLAKALTDTKKSTPEAVLDALTEPKNQRRISEFASALEGLATAEPGMIAAEVTLVFAQGKDMTNLLFSVLNSVAPEKNFGRPVDDQSPAGMRKNLSKIVDNWGDGVDLSVIDELKI